MKTTVIRADPWLFLALLALLAVPAAAAEVDEIVRRAEEPFTLQRVYSVSEMSIYHGNQPAKTVEFESYSLTSGGVTRSLLVYTEPLRMRGTAYLTVGDDLWVRFGLTGRVRKLSSAARRGSAGGSDFSYEDLGEGSGGISESYRISLLEERASVDGRQCFEIELVPAPATDSTYDRLVAYITRDSYRYVEIHYYESGAHTKTLTLSDYREVGGMDYPFFMSMRTHASRTRTEIVAETVEPDSDAVRESMFTPEYLESL